MKILNLYAGIGGNRKLWGNEHKITAVEYNKDIAEIYQDFFPNDKVIIVDAHQYLLEHYKEYDFIWSSPPCPTHSDIRRCGVHAGNYKALYPDMTLYQQIILLQNFAPKTNKWIVENVIPYYDYLIKPNVILGRHPFWCNFPIFEEDFIDKRRHVNIKPDSIVYGFNLLKYKKDKEHKRKMLRNMVNPEIGKYILDQAMNIKNLDQMELFK